MISDRITNAQAVPESRNVEGVPDARPNESLLSDPIGVNVGQLKPIDSEPEGSATEPGSIDGLPGRFERQAEEDAEPGLDLPLVPIGAGNE
jgi:hypothetical protein